jgi:hypothetical protein
MKGFLSMTEEPLRLNIGTRVQLFVRNAKQLGDVAKALV